MQHDCCYEINGLDYILHEFMSKEERDEHVAYCKTIGNDCVLGKVVRESRVILDEKQACECEKLKKGKLIDHIVWSKDVEPKRHDMVKCVYCPEENPAEMRRDSVERHVKRYHPEKLPTLKN